MLLELRRAFYLEYLLPGCWGDQESCELEELVIAELAELSAKPFLIRLLTNIQFEYEKF